MKKLIFSFMLIFGIIIMLVFSGCSKENDEIINKMDKGSESIEDYNTTRNLDKDGMPTHENIEEATSLY